MISGGTGAFPFLNLPNPGAMNRPSTSRPAPKWSIATSFWFSTTVTVIVTLLITLTVHKSLWVELEIVTGVLAALMFGYFTVILHQGVRFTDTKRAIVDWPAGGMKNLRDTFVWAPDAGPFTQAGLESGLVGIIVGFLLDIVIMIVFAFLVNLLLWLGLSAIVAIVLFLFWVHTRWLRYLVTNGRRCRGNWAKSLLHGATTTLRFSVWFYLWFYAAFFIAQKVTELTTH